MCGVSPKRLEPGVVNYDRILHHTEGDKKIKLAGKDLSVRPSEQVIVLTLIVQFAGWPYKIGTGFPVKL